MQTFRILETRGPSVSQIQAGGHLGRVCGCVFTKPTHLVIKCVGNILLPVSRCDGGGRKPDGPVRAMGRSSADSHSSSLGHGLAVALRPHVFHFLPGRLRNFKDVCSGGTNEAWGRQGEAGRGQASVLTHLLPPCALGSSKPPSEASLEAGGGGGLQGMLQAELEELSHFGCCSTWSPHLTPSRKYND